MFVRETKAAIVTDRYWLLLTFEHQYATWKAVAVGQSR